MSSFEIDFSWEAPGRAKRTRASATWAQFKVSADNTSITQVVYYRAKTIRESIYLPLYPLAEWIATHWWWLLYEMQSPGRPQDDIYVGRHNFAYAREGYALPDLNILPIGGSVILDWHAINLREQRVRFVTSGRAIVELRAFEAELVRLVEATLERLEQEGVTESFCTENGRRSGTSIATNETFAGRRPSWGWRVSTFPQKTPKRSWMRPAGFPPKWETSSFRLPRRESCLHKSRRSATRLPAYPARKLNCRPSLRSRPRFRLNFARDSLEGGL